MPRSIRDWTGLDSCCGSGSGSDRFTTGVEGPVDRSLHPRLLTRLHSLLLDRRNVLLVASIQFLFFFMYDVGVVCRLYVFLLCLSMYTCTSCILYICYTMLCYYCY